MAGISSKRIPDPEAAASLAYSPGLTAPENRQFYPALNGFRAIAVLGVFAHHYHLFSRPDLDWGWAGVDAFFVLSGFLITGILYDTRDAAHRFRNFYGRRVLRIFPLYYAVLLFILVTTPWMRWVWHPALLMWPLYLGNYSRFFWLHDWLQAPNLIDQVKSGLPLPQPLYLFIGHFWSLCVEEQFYLFWPFVVFFVRDRVRLRNLCFGGALLCLALRVLCLFVIPQPYLQAELLNRSTFLRADALLLGAALALMLRGPEAPTLLRLPRVTAPLFIAGFFLFEAVFHSLHGMFYSPMGGAPVLTTAGYSLIDVFSGLIILSAITPGSWTCRLLSLRPLQQLGMVSYGFYVFHDLFHDFCWRIASQMAPSLHLSVKNITMAMAFVLTLLLSAFSFRYFESPFLRLKNRFAE